MVIVPCEIRSGASIEAALKRLALPSQSFELARPLGRRIAQASDANAAGQATLKGSLDERRSDEG
jgi:hypothetical protein